MHNQAGHSMQADLGPVDLKAKEKHICIFISGKLKGFLNYFDKYTPKWLSVSGRSGGICIWCSCTKDPGLANSDMCPRMDNKEIAESLLRIGFLMRW